MKTKRDPVAGSSLEVENGYHLPQMQASI